MNPAGDKSKKPYLIKLRGKEEEEGIIEFRIYTTIVKLPCI